MELTDRLQILADASCAGSGATMIAFTWKLAWRAAALMSPTPSSISSRKLQNVKPQVVVALGNTAFVEGLRQALRLIDGAGPAVPA